MQDYNNKSVMDKPILIDSLFINVGGAVNILNRLIDGLVNDNIKFVLLKDIRCQKLHSEDQIQEVISMQPSIKLRHQFYKKNGNKYSKVVCMGNIPPSIKLKIPVTTYFHNLTIINIPPGFTLKRKIRFWIRRIAIILWSKNTDCWVVQTQNSLDTLKAAIPHSKHIYQYPIYSIPKEFIDDGRKNRSGFIFVGEYSYAKGHDELLEAWKILHERGVNPLLKLTVSKDCEFKSKLTKEISRGLNILNYGFLNYMELPELYKSSKALIYPSFNESLGLGLIEASIAGCDIIASDYPYTYSVCKPSVVFDPTNPNSIADAVCKYLNENTCKSELTISDKLKDFLGFIENL